MSSRQPQMVPAAWPAWNTGPGNSGHLTGPQSTSDVETQMAEQAYLKIKGRVKAARLFQEYRAQLTSNKYDVTVTSDPVSTEEKICLTVHRKKKVVPLTVKNSGVTAVHFTFRPSNLEKKIFTVKDCHGNIIKTIKRHTLGPGESYKIKVHFHSRHAGFYEQLLVFKFETCQESSDKFQIMRLLEVIRLASCPDEDPQTATNSLSDCQADELTVKLGPSLLPPVVHLKTYGMPEGTKHVKDTDNDLQRPLKWANYSRRFHLLLHLEELQLKTEIEKYDQDGVTMLRHKSNRNIFILQTADVSQSWTETLSRSQVLVTPLGQSTVYKGWVRHVDAEQIYVQMDEVFQNDFKEGVRVSVKFTIDRKPLRTQHRAAELVSKHKLKKVLFPTKQLSLCHQHAHRLSDLESNPEQCTAIEHIVSGTAKPAPYLVFGPPGTGKTVTLVKAIKQIQKTQASCKILVCAPSNSAADHLCEKILEENIDAVCRLYALSFPVRKIPQNIKSCCNLNYDSKTLIIPPKWWLMKQKILVSTLQTAGRLVTAGIPPSHYTYIFVDEAGQATETECIIPLAGLMERRRCQVVLAGDPKQLGPVISSTMAKEHGMDLSLLERLMGCRKLYKPHETQGFNKCFITKLLRNYRSHPAILKIPNELFYKGELQAYADEEKCSSFCQWECLPKKGFPLIFHGVAGTDDRDASNPSFYNMAEVEVLKEYLKALVHHLHKKGVNEIRPGEIGIIAPYRKQVEKIQQALQTDKHLKAKNLENILIGSVEKFQGKEFNVILLSTVRSTPKLTAHKQRFTLGFVANEKRFNVALTRARALLIVVGDPRVLKTDEIWNKFIHYCYTEGGYRGISVFDAEEEEDTD